MSPSFFSPRSHFQKKLMMSENSGMVLFIKRLSRRVELVASYLVAPIFEDVLNDKIETF